MHPKSPYRILRHLVSEIKRTSTADSKSVLFYVASDASAAESHLASLISIQGLRPVLLRDPVVDMLTLEALHLDQVVVVTTAEVIATLLGRTSPKVRVIYAAVIDGCKGHDRRVSSCFSRLTAAFAPGAGSPAANARTPATRPVSLWMKTHKGCRLETVYQLVPGTTHLTNTVTGKRPRSSHVNSALSHLQLPESARAMGQAFLKLYVGLDLFAAAPNITPGVLSQIRNVLHSGIELEKNGIMSTMIPSAKARLGAAVLEGGLEAGLNEVKGIIAPSSEICRWSDFAVTFTKCISNWGPQALVALLPDLRALEKSLGHEFKDISLLDRALALDTLPATQMETLGDAVLDVLAAEYWLLEGSESAPSTIAHLKATCTTNSFLAVIVARFSWLEPTITDEIHKESLRKAVATIIAEDSKAASGAVERWWENLRTPKVFGDLVESIVGAIYLDAEFDLDAVRPMFDKCIRPVIVELLGQKNKKPRI
ncbi:Dicer-like protein 2 [Modicella reniformis]|uniref:Dicer-like protein 2 n=1 Tax=Modicella reniformis TaxID=1440133 RepID=A0A9P6MHI9_9FUNG|nr:Dicer-like protein 2 [Modicella reniformis]